MIIIIIQKPFIDALQIARRLTRNSKAQDCWLPWTWRILASSAWRNLPPTSQSWQPQCWREQHFCSEKGLFSPADASIARSQTPAPSPQLPIPPALHDSKKITPFPQFDSQNYKNNNHLSWHARLRYLRRPWRVSRARLQWGWPWMREILCSARRDFFSFWILRANCRRELRMLEGSAIARSPFYNFWELIFYGVWRCFLSF